MAISSRITVNDGVTSVNVDGRASLQLRINRATAGGATNLRMADGSITRQVAWEKDRVTVTCAGWTPPGLDSIDWSRQITLTVPAPGGTEQFGPPNLEVAQVIRVVNEPHGIDFVVTHSQFDRVLAHQILGIFLNRLHHNSF